MERVSQRHGKNYYRVIPVFKEDDAVAALKEVGLVLGNITYVISDNEKGVVENQDPPAGTNLGSGSSIDITINEE